MSHTLLIEELDTEITINNPENVDDWVEAVKFFCDDFAQQHYPLRYEPGHYVDLQEDSLKKLAEAVGLAIKEFRGLTDEQVGDSWMKSWNSILESQIGEVVDEWFEGSDELQAAMSHNNFDEIYQYLDAAMSEIDGPVADLDEVYERLQHYTEEKMMEHDNSTPMDYIRGNAIPLTFTPGLDLTVGGRDDAMFYRENPCDPGVIALLTLLRIPGVAMLEDHEVDYTNRDEMVAWDKILGVNFNHRPVNDARILKDILENASTYNLPMWRGDVDIKELKSANFREPVVFKGGVVGAIDYINGAGYMDAVEDYFILDVKDVPSCEAGYTVQSIFDFTRNSLSATIHSLKSVESKLAKETEIILKNDAPSI